jgi:hypothetical protein
MTHRAHTAHQATQTIKDAVHRMDTAQKSRALPVTGRGGPQGCEMSRTAHCLDSRLTDGGEVVSPTHLPFC